METIFFPLIFLMRIILEFSYSVTQNYGISILLLSLAVNTLILPLYYIAEKYKQADKKHQLKMAPEINKIKRSYQGRERHFYIQAIYRRYRYHPISSVKASMGLLLQIPFFIAAFQFLSHYQPLQGVSFGFISDLSKPDALFKDFNLLPVLMTAVNLASALVYQKSLARNERWQLWGLSGVFLVLLYSEASGLLLYWTMNNVYSLVKNIIQKYLFGIEEVMTIEDDSQHQQHVFVSNFVGIFQQEWKLHFNVKNICVLLFAFSGLYFFYLHHSLESVEQAKSSLLLSCYGLGLGAFLTLVFSYRNVQKGRFQYWLWFLIVGYGYFQINHLFISSEKFQLYDKVNIAIVFLVLMLSFLVRYFSKFFVIDQPVKWSELLLPIINISLLLYFVNPSILFNASPDFTISVSQFLIPNFIVFFLTGLGSILLFFLFTSSMRHMYVFSVNSVLFLSFIYSFIVLKNFGLLDHFKFNQVALLNPSFVDVILDVVMVSCGFAFSYLLFLKSKKHYKMTQLLILCVLLVMFLFNLPQNKMLKTLETSNEAFQKELDTTLAFSKEQKNILVLMLDGYSGSQALNLLEEDPTAFNEFEGFTFYQNTLSIGAGTRLSLAALLAGHEFAFHKLIERYKKPEDGIEHAYKLLTQTFLQDQWKVTFFNPQLVGRLDSQVNHVSFDYQSRVLKGVAPHAALEQPMLIALSLFRSLPLLLKKAFYANGEWAGIYTAFAKAGYGISYKAPSWGILNELNSHLNQNAKGKTFKFFQIQSPHPPVSITETGELNINKSSLKIEVQQLTKKISQILTKLKVVGVYDNTKIILVSDHGWWNIRNKKFGDFQGYLDSWEERVTPSMAHALMMVKDFGAQTPFQISDAFMSNADLASIICSEIDNQAAKCPIVDKDPTKFPRSSSALTITNSSKEGDKKVHIYEVKNSIFDGKNWRQIQ